jgi:hypothetical protein
LAFTDTPTMTPSSKMSAFLRRVTTTICEIHKESLDGADPTDGSPPYFLPARLGYPRDKALESHFAEGYSGYHKSTNYTAGTPCHLTSISDPSLCSISAETLKLKSCFVSILVTHSRIYRTLTQLFPDLSLRVSHFFTFLVA